MPRYRTGHRVPLNVYDGDRPIFQAHSEQDAERFVALMNIGERIETVTAAEIAQHIEGAFDDLAAKLALDGLPSGRTVAEHLAPVVMAEVLGVSHQSHLSAPESASEPPAGTGQPADDSGPQGEGWLTLRCGWCGHWRKSEFTKDDVAEWLRAHRNATIGHNDTHTVAWSSCPEPCGGVE